MEVVTWRVNNKSAYESYRSLLLSLSIRFNFETFELSISGFTFYHFANLFELSKRSARRYSHPWSRAVDLKRTQHDVVNNSIRNLIRTSVSEERNLCSRESAIRLSRWKTIARKLWSIQVACVPIEMENGWRSRKDEEKFFANFRSTRAVFEFSRAERIYLIVEHDRERSCWKIAAVSKEFRRIPVRSLLLRSLPIQKHYNFSTKFSGNEEFFSGKNIFNLFPTRV